MPASKLKIDPLKIILMKLEDMDAKIDIITKIMDEIHAHLSDDQSDDENNSFEVHAHLSDDQSDDENNSFKIIQKPEKKDEEIKILSEKDMMKLQKKIERSNKGVMVELVN